MWEFTGSLKDIVTEMDKLGLAWRTDVLQCMVEHPKMLKDVQDSLSGMGFRRFEYLGSGAHAVGLHATEGQVVRLCREMDDVTMERPFHPVILQPIETRHIKTCGVSVRVEILPKVRTDIVTDADISMVYHAMTDSGWFVGDVSKEGNVGIIEVGGKRVPVLIDVGRLTPMKRKRQETDEHLNPWKDENGEWLQKAFEKRTEASGLIVSASLEKAERGLRGRRPIRDSLASMMRQKPVDSRRSSQTMLAITEDGFYPEQLAELYSRAAAKTDNAENFCDVLKSERALMSEELKR